MVVPQRQLRLDQPRGVRYQARRNLEEGVAGGCTAGFSVTIFGDAFPTPDWPRVGRVVWSLTAGGRVSARVLLWFIAVPSKFALKCRQCSEVFVSAISHATSPVTSPVTGCGKTHSGAATTM